MAYLSKAAYKGNGSTVQYSAPFPYISRAHVVVTVNKTPVSFTWLNTGTVQLTAAPANGSSVVVKRVTPRNTRLVDFADGSYLTERELDLSALQLLYILQEILDDVADTIHYDFSADKYDAQGKPVTNVGDPITDADVVTLNYYKTTVLPMLLNLVEEAVNAFTGDMRAELENYRTLLASYESQLETATTAAVETAEEAVATINGLLSAFEAQHVAAVDGITALAKGSTQDIADLASVSKTDIRVLADHSTGEIRVLASTSKSDIQGLADGKAEKLEGIAASATSKYSEYLTRLDAILSEMLAYKNGILLSVAECRAARDETKAVVADVKDFSYMGDWKNGTLYRPQNVVYHGGSSYVLVSGDGTNEPPGGDWRFLAKRGESYYARILDGGTPDTEFTVFIDGGTPDEF